MDVDHIITTNQDVWSRLDALTRRAARDPRRLSTAELDELVTLHLRVSSHLASVRTHAHDADLAAHLSALVARSSAVVHGTRPRSLRQMLRAVTVTFPAAVWHARIAILVSTAIFLVAAVAVGAWIAWSDAAVQASAPAEVRDAYVQTQFAEYYSSEPSATFAARVFTNNAGVGAMAFGSGILFGLPTLAILVLNGVNVGVAAGLFYAAGDPGTFWSLILPHGLLELTAVFIAGGAGLMLGWAAAVPGDRRRSVALAEEGRRSVVIVIGLVGVFLIAGLLEGFVTAAPWPTWARVGTGALVWLGFLGWVSATGRAAAARGLTGALGEVALTDDHQRPDHQPPAHQPPRALVSR